MNLDDIKEKVDKLASTINAPLDKLPSFGYYEREYHTYIQIDEDGYMSCSEKSFDDNGNEDVFEMKTQDIDELLYWIFGKITRSMGWDYTRTNRDRNQTFVEQRLKKQEELIGLINEAWQKRCILDNEDIRRRNEL